jgi:hypothetical protein
MYLNLCVQSSPKEHLGGVHLLVTVVEHWHTSNVEFLFLVLLDIPRSGIAGLGCSI